ncbi:B-box zinc finger domain-containing protein [Babesia caballi]|uniref:B-box zinc finger domain-containing protein n=1 Tax=Babesia caballi TaxID=5871 RepID=A0AAV4LYF9_BABCB|nr:B-box zinc finger domain-containing protein [Babesia caballi]
MTENARAAAAPVDVPFVPKPLEDIHELTYLEYLLQMAFHTTDLHVIKGLQLASPETEARFRQEAAKRFRGSFLSVWVDMNRMEPPQSFEDCVARGAMSVDLTQQLFESGTISPPLGFQGNPTGSYRMLLFKVALGRTLAHTPEAGDQEAFLRRPIPPGYDSMELCASTEPAFYNALYRINSSQQTLLCAAVEFEFTPVKIEVPEPVCEMCETAVAQWYCHSDKAHFCNACDAKHHSVTPIFARHVRVASSKSPVQFGVCESHPSEIIDVVCLQCNRALCSHCILFDAHSDPSFFDHQLMSTVDAYDCAMQKTSESDQCLQRRMEGIAARVRNRHSLLSQLYANFNNVRQKIDGATALLLEQLGGMRQRKLRYIEAIRREAETELLLLDWLEAFMGHLLLALNPADFITSRKRYDLLVAKMFGGECKVGLGNMPLWMLQRLVLVGGTRLCRVPLAQQGVDGAAAAEPGVAVASDFTRTNLFQDLGDTVGHVGGEDVDLRLTIESILRSEPLRLKGVPPDDPAGSPGAAAELEAAEVGAPPTEAALAVQAHVLEPVWALLSEGSMATLLHLVRAARIPEKCHLIRHLAALANHFEEMDALVAHACAFEAQGLRDSSLCMLLRSSSCLNELLCFVLLHDRYGCAESLEWVRLYCDCLHAFLADAADAKQAAEEAASHIVNKLAQFADMAAMPSTLRFVLYYLADLAGERAASLCVDMLFGVLLSTYVARNVRGLRREALTETSFLMGRVGIACWDAVETTSLEFCLAARLKVWMQGLLRRPRLKSRIHTRPTPVVAEALDYVLRALSKMSREVHAGTSDLPVEQVNELTARYNFIPLFEIADRWAGRAATGAVSRHRRVDHAAPQVPLVEAEGAGGDQQVHVVEGDALQHPLELRREARALQRQPPALHAHQLAHPVPVGGAVLAQARQHLVARAPEAVLRHRARPGAQLGQHAAGLGQDGLRLVEGRVDRDDVVPGELDVVEHKVHVRLGAGRPGEGGVQPQLLGRAHELLDVVVDVVRAGHRPGQGLVQYLGHVRPVRHYPAGVGRVPAHEHHGPLLVVRHQNESVLLLRRTGVRRLDISRLRRPTLPVPPEGEPVLGRGGRLRQLDGADVLQQQGLDLFQVEVSRQRQLHGATPEYAVQRRLHLVDTCIPHLVYIHVVVHQLPLAHRRDQVAPAVGVQVPLVGHPVPPHLVLGPLEGVRLEAVVLQQRVHYLQRALEVAAAPAGAPIGEGHFDREAVLVGAHEHVHQVLAAEHLHLQAAQAAHRAALHHGGGGQQQLPLAPLQSLHVFVVVLHRDYRLHRHLVALPHPQIHAHAVVERQQVDSGRPGPLVVEEVAGVERRGQRLPQLGERVAIPAVGDVVHQVPRPLQDALPQSAQLRRSRTVLLDVLRLGPQLQRLPQCTHITLGHRPKVAAHGQRPQHLFLRLPEIRVLLLGQHGIAHEGGLQAVRPPGEHLLPLLVAEQLRGRVDLGVQRLGRERLTALARELGLQQRLSHAVVPDGGIRRRRRANQINALEGLARGPRKQPPRHLVHFVDAHAREYLRHHLLLRVRMHHRPPAGGRVHEPRDDVAVLRLRAVQPGAVQLQRVLHDLEHFLRRALRGQALDLRHCRRERLLPLVGCAAQLEGADAAALVRAVEVVRLHRLDGAGSPLQNVEVQRQDAVGQLCEHGAPHVRPGPQRGDRHFPHDLQAEVLDLVVLPDVRSRPCDRLSISLREPTCMAPIVPCRRQPPPAFFHRPPVHLGVLAQVALHQLRLFLHVSKHPLHHRHRRPRLDVAHHEQPQVRRSVVDAVVVQQVLHAVGLQASQVPDWKPLAQPAKAPLGHIPTDLFSECRASTVAQFLRYSSVLMIRASDRIACRSFSTREALNCVGASTTSASASSARSSAPSRPAHPSISEGHDV